MSTTEFWLTPLILLPGVALLIVSTSSRFSQIHTEFHHLLDHKDGHAKILSRNLRERSRLFRDALASLYISVGLFSLGSLLGGVVNLWRPESLWFVGAVIIAGIGCVVFASMQLVRESFLSLRVIEEHYDRIENGDRS